MSLKTYRFTKLEAQMLARCAEAVAAGEWPWQPNTDGTDPVTEGRERAAFTCALKKLTPLTPEQQDWAAYRHLLRWVAFVAPLLWGLFLMWALIPFWMAIPAIGVLAYRFFADNTDLMMVVLATVALCVAIGLFAPKPKHLSIQAPVEEPLPGRGLFGFYIDVDKWARRIRKLVRA